MVRVILTDLAHVHDPLSGHDCGGGYAEDYCIYVDSRLSEAMQGVILIHEVIEEFLGRKSRKIIQHAEIDHIAVAILDAQRQLKEQRHDST